MFLKGRISRTTTVLALSTPVPRRVLPVVAKAVRAASGSGRDG